MTFDPRLRIRKDNQVFEDFGVNPKTIETGSPLFVEGDFEDEFGRFLFFEPGTADERFVS